MATATTPKKKAVHPLSEDVKRPLDLSQVKRGWYNATREYDYWVPQADVEGEVPSTLRGTLFRNGPGLLEIYGKKLIHRKSDRESSSPDYKAVQLLYTSPSPLFLSPYSDRGNAVLEVKFNLLLCK